MIALDESGLRDLLPVAGLGEPLSFYQKIGSTNDVAVDLANQGARHGTLVIAEEQTEGRGRRGSRWITVSGSAIALSVILRPPKMVPDAWARFHALGALAVVEALEQYRLSPEIKWPNDVLLKGRKVAGVLVDASWEGEEVDYVVLGIGVNVSPGSVPENLSFPAISIEEVLGQEIKPEELLVFVLKGIGTWFNFLPGPELITKWEHLMAYRGKEVNIEGPEKKRTGRLIGLNPEGMLRILYQDGGMEELGVGEYQVRLNES